MYKNIDLNSDKNEFAKKICELLKVHSEININSKGYFTLVLSGGKTPIIIFDYLALNYKDTIDWNNIHFFWLDERCINPYHKDSNFKLANDHLISKLKNVGSINRIKGEIDPDLATKDYNNKIIKFFGENEMKFDFLLIGMGEDGHVASLFPGSNELKKEKELVLATEKKYNGYRRISLGLDLINASTFKLLFIKGVNKLSVLKDTGNLPVSKISNPKIFYLNK